MSKTTQHETDFQEWVASIFLVDDNGEYVDEPEELPEDPRPDTDEDDSDIDADEDLEANRGLDDYGGPGSGHFGHAGRPGAKGGSVSKDTAVSTRTGKDAAERKAAGKEAAGKEAAKGAAPEKAVESPPKKAVEAPLAPLDKENSKLLFIDPEVIDDEAFTDANSPDAQKFTDICDKALSDSKVKFDKSLKGFKLEEAQAAALKKITAEALEKRIKGDTEIEAFLKDAHVGFPGYQPGQGQIGASIHQWAETTGDTNKRANFLQLMAQKEFGLESTWRVRSKEMRAELEASGVLNDDSPQAKGARKLLRAMYDSTQETLAAHGITELTLFRGTSLSEKKIPKDIPFGAIGNATVKTQPLTSFSASQSVATEFLIYGEITSGKSAVERRRVNTLIGAKVPANRILSMPGTGFGCYTEKEFVVLGGSDEVTIAPQLI